MRAQISPHLLPNPVYLFKSAVDVILPHRHAEKSTCYVP